MKDFNVKLKPILSLLSGGGGGSGFISGGGGVTFDIQYFVLAGGGGGGFDVGGGGGAGGLRFNTSADYAVSTGTAYTLTVGAGGAGGDDSGVRGANGSPSVFDNITAAGGGGGGTIPIGVPSVAYGGDGGSGGAGRRNGSYQGSGNTPPISPIPQGNPGGSGNPNPGYGSGGGGGFHSAGTMFEPSPSPQGPLTAAGTGGRGFNISPYAPSIGPIFGIPSINGGAIAGGGGGGSDSSNQMYRGLGKDGGGDGGKGYPSPTTTPNYAQDGVDFTGGGGGGGGNAFPGSAMSRTGGDGGGGLVVLLYPNEYTLSHPVNLVKNGTPQPVPGSRTYTQFVQGSGTVTFS